MKIEERPSLRRLNTLGVEARAALLIGVESEEDVLDLPAFDPNRDLVLGGGSNVLLAGDVPGTVFHNRIAGRAVVAEDDEHALIEAGAGEDWHALVLWTLDRGLSGLENLSLIPGRVGAAPVQNIGAYGVELSSVLESVTAWDWQQARWARLDREQCRLGYRDSLFKSGCPDRYLITSIRLRLERRFRPQLDYAGLREELAAMGIGQPTARQVSAAVIKLRRRKLPDPAEIGNAGSFFKNPVLDEAAAHTLLREHPGMPHWASGPGQLKVSAAWLIERCGMKAYREGDAGVSAQHALVLVNHGSATGREILEVASKVQRAVRDRFGLCLETEPKVVTFAA